MPSSAIFSVLDEIYRSDYQYNLAHNTEFQFGFAGREYLGAKYLPEIDKLQNQFTEDKVIYYTVVANDGTRYSAPKLVEGELIGSFDVKLGEIDVARQLTGNDFDNLARVAITNPNAARDQVEAWMNTAVNMALKEKKEIQRWQAICNASVPIQGRDGMVTTIQMSNPTGHRLFIPSGTTTSPAGWYGASYDLMTDFVNARNLMVSLGYEIGAVIGDVDIMSAIMQNPILQSRLGTLTFAAGGQLTSRAGLVDLNTFQAYLQSSFGLPPIQEYNLTYRTQTGIGHFKPRGKLVFLAVTARNQQIDLGDQIYTLENTLGYQAVGTAVGETTPGDVIRSTSSNMKPIGMYTQGFGTTFPVVCEPEAIVVLTIPKPTPV